jgi:hypothetical protein
LRIPIRRFVCRSACAFRLAAVWVEREASFLPVFGFLAPHAVKLAAPFHRTSKAFRFPVPSGDSTCGLDLPFRRYEPVKASSFAVQSRGAVAVKLLRLQLNRKVLALRFNLVGKIFLKVFHVNEIRNSHL